MTGGVAPLEVGTATVDICSRLLVIGDRNQSHPHIGSQRCQLCEEPRWCSVAIPKSRSLNGKSGRVRPRSRISDGRALSRGCESRSTKPPMKTASRRIRVTIPPAFGVARSRLLRRASHMRGSGLTVPATSESPRSTRAGASEIAPHLPRPCDRLDGSSSPTSLLVTPVQPVGVPDDQAAAPLAAVESPIPA